MKTSERADTQAHRRKIIVYIATSVDGYIARPDGDVDWLNRPMPKGGYGMDVFARSIDTVLWGRKTYDFAVKMGGLGVYGNVKHYVFSRQSPSDPLPEAEFVSDLIPEFVARLRARKGKNIWMMGGSIDHWFLPGLRCDRRILDPCHPRHDWRRDSARRSSPSEYPARIEFRPFLPGRRRALELHRSVLIGCAS